MNSRPISFEVKNQIQPSTLTNGALTDAFGFIAYITLNLKKFFSIIFSLVNCPTMIWLHINNLYFSINSKYKLQI